MPGGNGFSRAFAVTTENEETKMTDIIIQGIGGRMGHALCEMIANRSDCRVVAGIDQQDGEQNGIPVYDSLDKLDGKGDVIIDFSAPAAVEKFYRIGFARIIWVVH
jgi:4-hydroxy-tetrahydrodipicolinate reductase